LQIEIRDKIHRPQKREIKKLLALVFFQFMNEQFLVLATAMTLHFLFYSVRIFEQLFGITGGSVHCTIRLFSEDLGKWGKEKALK